MTVLDYLLSIGLILSLAAAIYFRHRARAAEAEARQAQANCAEAIAGRSAAEQRALADAGHLASLGEASLDALLLVDASRQILWGNPAAWEMFAAAEPAVGRSFMSLVQDYELNQAIVDAILGGRAIVRQTVIGGRTLRIRAVPVANDGGAAVAIEDVTELQRLGRARRDFVANLSHELRTPLANIALAAQTIQESGTRDEALVARMLEQIQAQVQALSQLNQEIMDLAQIESGQVLLKLVPAPVAPLVQRALAAMSPQAKRKSQQITLSVPEDLEALMDEQQVARVIGNLLHNAIKFTPEGGAIHISAETAGDDVRICVADTGPGIPFEDQARIFERFYKQDRARSKGGTGLGLAIARHIVEGHGGRIWVESVPGEGARFYFTLPRAQ